MVETNEIELAIDDAIKTTGDGRLSYKEASGELLRRLAATINYLDGDAGGARNLAA